MSELNSCESGQSLTPPHPEGNQLSTGRCYAQAVNRFPPRTLILMTLALFAFAWFWWRMHPKPARPPEVQIIVIIDGGVP